MQTALGTILAPLEDLAVDLSTAVSLGDTASALTHAATARADFKGTVSALNAQVAGQSLFAGTATDRAALAPADAILADLDALAAGGGDGARTRSRRSTPISPGRRAASTRPATPARATTWQRSTSATATGSTQGSAPTRTSSSRCCAGRRSRPWSRAAPSPATSDAQMTMLGAAADSLLPAKEGLLALRSALGTVQETVENAKAQRVAERETIDLARTALLATDPLEAASTFDALENQLNAIYTVTARLSSLRFLNFMS